MSIPIKIKRKADGSIDNITFCPTVTIEKQVWESTLHHSMVLQAENWKLKDIITEMCCQLVDDNDDMSLGLAEYFDQDILIKIREALK